ncbi:hypothetical protein HD806DRAFT_214918 [Xylariaceae sp. AK1471]|nr:hypothetical protein HD806DRAFT_214918 [Xylariaceae sp. AK1471]
MNMPHLFARCSLVIRFPIPLIHPISQVSCTDISGPPLTPSNKHSSYKSVMADNRSYLDPRRQTIPDGHGHEHERRITVTVADVESLAQQLSNSARPQDNARVPRPIQHGEAATRGSNLDNHMYAISQIIPSDENTTVYLDGLPPDCDYEMLLSEMRDTGKIFKCSIFGPLSALTLPPP